VTAAPRIERVGAAQVRVSGRLGFAEAAGALARSGELSGDGAGEVGVDVSGLTAIDSATLAVLLAWAARARTQGTALHFTAVPPDLAALARLCGAGPLLA
jgi:phospholipid transport system transporter-binding protein